MWLSEALPPLFTYPSVSHDRYFLDRTVDRIFSFENKCLKRFEGNYSDFLDKRKVNSQNHIGNPPFKKDDQPKNNKPNNSKQSEVSQNSSKPISPPEKPRRRSFKESKELQRLENTLPLLDSRRIEIEKELNQGNKDLVMLSQELAELVETIQSAEERWIKLSELSP